MFRKEILAGIFVAFLVPKSFCHDVELELSIVVTLLGMRGTDDLLCVNLS